MSDEFESVKWQGTVGIEQASALRNSLLEAFKKSSEVRLDISDVEDIDITGIQLIIAAHREAKKTQKKFFLVGDIPSVIDEFAKASAISLRIYHIEHDANEEDADELEEADDA